MINVNITFDKVCCEATFLHRAVGHELHVEFAGGGLDVVGNLVATVGADEGRAVLVAVTHLQVVVHAIVMALNLKPKTWLVSVERDLSNK